jgi:hypothetical protein
MAGPGQTQAAELTSAGASRVPEALVLPGLEGSGLRRRAESSQTGVEIATGAPVDLSA